MARQRTTLNKLTRAQSVQDQIRQLIGAGELAPGDRLQEEMLAQRLEVSRTPVRQALVRLAGEGLISHEPHCGYMVREFDIADVRRAMDVRMVLEGLAARNVASIGLELQNHRELKENLEESKDILHRPQWDETLQQRWFVLNHQFHDTILAGADNDYLADLVVQARQIPGVWGNHARRFEHSDLSRLFQQRQSQEALADHQSIFYALEQRQADRVEFLMRDHIFKNRETMIRNFHEALQAGRFET